MPTSDSILFLPGGVTLPLRELRFEFSRSGGPGGQNVNKVNTRVTLLFDVAGSPSLTDELKRAVRGALGGRINQQGILRVISSKHRTQPANRAAAVERFAELLTHVLTPRKRRKKSRVPAMARIRRLEAKGRRSDTKRMRRPKPPDE